MSIEEIKSEVLEYIEKTKKEKNGITEFFKFIVFLEQGRNSEITLLGTNKDIPSYTNDSKIKDIILPTFFNNWLIKKLHSFIDEDFAAYYSFLLSIPKDEIHKLENLIKIRDYEVSNKQPDKNKRLGDLAFRLNDNLTKYYWDNSTSITQTQRYVFIYDLLIDLGELPSENRYEMSANEKQNKISKYLEAYTKYSFKHIEFLRKV